MEPLPPRRRTLLHWELGVFVGALLLRLWVLSRYTGTPYSALQMGDMRFYHEWALRILQGEWSDGKAFYGLPGYAYLLAGFYIVLGTNFPLNWVVIAVVQSIWEALTAVLIFKFARTCCESETDVRSGSRRWLSPRITLAPALLGSLAYVLFVPAQCFSTILMPTAWLVCAYWWCVWQALQTTGEERVLRWWGLGLLIGVVAMMIATILFVLPLLLAAIVLRVGRTASPKQRAIRSSLAALSLLLGVGLGTAPAWLHNYLVAHDPVLLSAHGGLNFWMGNNPSATGYPKIPDGLRPSQEGLLRDSITWAEKAAGHPLKRTEVSRYWGAQANKYIHEHPAAWLRLMGIKIRNFWSGFQYDDISVVQLFRERGVTLPGLLFRTVAAFGLAGLLLVGWRPGPTRWVAAAVLLHMAALLSVFITERYRLAAVPGLIILGVAVVYRMVHAPRRAALFGMLAVFAVSVWATTGFTRDPALLSLEPYNLAVKELEVAEGLLARAGTPEEVAAAHAQAAHELEFAQRHLETAYQLLPGNAGICFAQGNLALARGDRAKAHDWYQQTLALSPSYAGALKNLGFLAVDGGEWAAGVPWLEQARALEPDNASTYYLLARARMHLGQTEEARALLKEALRMKPAQPEFLALAQQLAPPQP